MGRFFYAVALLLLCGVALGQDQLPAPRQFCVFNNPPTTSCAFAVNVVSGNVVIVVGSDAVFSTPTDTLSTTYNLITSDTSVNDTYLWCGVLTSSGANTVGNFPANADAVVVELPATVGCTVDASGHNTFTGSPATVTCPSITTTVNGDFIFSYAAGTAHNFQLSPTSPRYAFPIGAGGGGGGGNFAASYQVSGLAGSYNAVFTNVSTNSGACLIAAFKPAAISIVTSSLPTSALSVAYKYCLQAVGGAGAYTWSVSGGSLPSGLNINSGTGCISGTPTGPSTSPTFQVTDGTNTATASLTVTVNSAVNTIGFVNSAVVTGTSGLISMGTVTSGTLLVVSQNQQVVGASAGNSFSPPTDTLGTVFKLVLMFDYADIWNAIWMGTAPSTGSDTISIVNASIANLNGVAAQFSGAQAFFDVAGYTTGTNVGAATLTGPSLTTLVPNSELWLSVVGASTGSTWNAGAGYTIETLSSTASAMNAEHGAQSATGTYAPTFAQMANAAGQWIIEGLALRPATTGPVSGQYRHKGWIF